MTVCTKKNSFFRHQVSCVTPWHRAWSDGWLFIGSSRPANSADDYN